MTDYKSRTEEKLKIEGENRIVYTRIFTVPSVGNGIHDDRCCFFLFSHIVKDFSK